jgi:hypothetical protein
MASSLMNSPVAMRHGGFMPVRSDGIPGLGRHLNVGAVRPMTNNPDQVETLRRAGMVVGPSSLRPRLAFHGPEAVGGRS